MNITSIDLMIVCLYLVSIVVLGLWISNKSKKNVEGYFLGGNSLKWQYLGLSNASGMFDISGTMWMVYLLFVYGLNSVFIPWLWPAFNQIFLIFVSLLRRFLTFR